MIILLEVEDLFYVLVVYSILTPIDDFKLKSMTKVMISTFQLLSSHFSTISPILFHRPVLYINRFTILDYSCFFLQQILLHFVTKDTHSIVLILDLRFGRY